ncbi:MAG: hypothetical protein M9910_06225 [Kiritimatiellae bacterium]|nr:hypothetical protein [Kiritimatiellia bacterium]
MKAELPACVDAEKPMRVKWIPTRQHIGTVGHLKNNRLHRWRKGLL